MRQSYEIRNNFDENLNPAGGSVTPAYNEKGESGKGIYIGWQDGPTRLNGEPVPPNGAFVEDVLEIAQIRLEFYQNSKFKCQENATAIQFIQLAREVLASRVARREADGTFGTHEGN